MAVSLESFRESGKSREKSRIIFPESQNAVNSWISGSGKGKPGGGNLGSTLPWALCPPSVRGVSAFSSFFERTEMPSQTHSPNQTKIVFRGILQFWGI